MSFKLNCWQYTNCGREKGGLMAELLGECPVPNQMRFDGLNGGKGAGRACWMVPDSCCRQSTCGTSHGSPCHQCEFYHRVLYEEEDKVCFAFVSEPTI